jgi:hypothetical protein
VSSDVVRIRTVTRHNRLEVVVKILVITKLGITMKPKILITDVDNKCLLHPSAIISVRSNVCVRPEDGYNMSRNMSPM